MSFQKLNSDSYCVGGRHRSDTTKNHGDITSKVSKVLNGYCSICNRKKSMTVSDNIIQAESLGDFSKNLGKKERNLSKKMAKIVLKTPGGALEIGANVGSLFASRSLKAALPSLPQVISFYHIGKSLYVRKIVWSYTISIEQKSNSLYGIAPVENFDSEQRLEKWMM